MKYLISFDTSIVGQDQYVDWGVDRILTIGGDLTADLSNLPQDNEALFFIPTVFDYNNSLSYEGADLGLRILMAYVRSGITDIDIVLMGNESELSFLQHYSYANIIKIPGIHYIRFNKKIVSTYQLPGREKLEAEDYKPYLDDLGLRMPSSLKSTHSLTNEWCLYKWNSFMGFEESDAKLQGYLYFDYLITIEKFSRTKSKTATAYLKERIKNFHSARILLIDDKNGWHKFFRDMFSDSPAVELHCMGENFSKLEYPEIEKKIADEVKDFNPDVIILDFRLMEDRDADIKDNMKEISGYKVLSEVLKGKYDRPHDSFGRQVIIFTATSRIENILMLKAGNADGFIIKERPESYNGKEVTKEVISKMVHSLETAVGRAKFLIPLNVRLTALNGIMISSPETKEKIKTVTESIRLITQNNSIDDNILKLGYLNLFSILESMKPIDIKFIDSYIQENSPNEILKFWDKIDAIRNALAHGDKTATGRGLKFPVTSPVLMEWTLILCDFVKDFVSYQFPENVR